MEITTEARLGDSKEQLKQLPEDSVDLIVTSPPYADQRKNTYGGIHPRDYVEWFLPISEQLLRVLKPTGTFILNIKEKAVNGERSVYVIRADFSHAQTGMVVDGRSLYGTRKTVIRESGLTGFAMPGSGFFNLTKTGNSTCTRKR